MGLPALSNSPGRHVRLGIYDYTVSEYNTYENRVSYERTDHVVREEAFSTRSPTTKTNIDHSRGFAWRPPTSYDRSVGKYTYSSGTKESEYQNQDGVTYKVTESGFKCGFGPQDLDCDWDLPHFGILNTDQHVQVKTECLLKLNEGKVHIGQFLAESKKSAELVADTSENLLKLLLAVKRGQLGKIPKDFRTLRRGVDGAYLQWEYGWKPLCSDLYGLHQNLVNTDTRPKIIHAKRQVRSSREFTHFPGGNEVRIQNRHRDTCEIWAEVKSELLASAQNIDVINPLSLGWELIPYSFVVDWFCPIGNTLAALTATAGLDFVGGYVSQVRETDYFITGDVGTAEKNTFNFRRGALSDFPTPGVYARENPLSPHRTVNLMALLRQLF